jgi:hypothetical protein
MSPLDLPQRAAIETAMAHGITPDRCDILQDGNTVVLRLTETLVARVVADLHGPRQGTGWFTRENQIAQHLSQLGAPVIPLHPDLPPGPHEHLGYTLNFWKFASSIDTPPCPREIGASLYRCHELLRSFHHPLPKLGIMTESLLLLEKLDHEPLLPNHTIQLLRLYLTSTWKALENAAMQPLHGDAHPGNLMNTTLGLLWTDWEDTFLGPVEWDLASIIWNARVLDRDHASADAILEAYVEAGGAIDSRVLSQCLIARAAVMSAWYPVLYPNPSPERQKKLQFRLDWLGNQMMASGA